jgi:hypothetical protein
MAPPPLGIKAARPCGLGTCPPEDRQRRQCLPSHRERLPAPSETISAGQVQQYGRWPIGLGPTRAELPKGPAVVGALSPRISVGNQVLGFQTHKTRGLEGRVGLEPTTSRLKEPVDKFTEVRQRPV